MKIFELLIGYLTPRSGTQPAFIQISILQGGFILGSGAIGTNLDQVSPGDFGHLTKLLERLKIAPKFLIKNGTAVEGGILKYLPRLSKLHDPELEKLKAIINSIVEMV